MKRPMILVLMAICSLKLYAQPLDGLYFSTGGDMFSPKISFKNNTISMILPVVYLEYRGIYINEAKYSYTIINGIYQISILWEHKIELYLLFNNEYGYFSIVFPFKMDSGILLNVTPERSARLPRGGAEDYIMAPGNVVINASSSLNENGREYISKNLTRLFISDPWVEGREDAGIGEYIELDYSQTYVKSVDTIVMSNGFFSVKNAGLYYQNNRVKRINIQDMNGNYIQDFDVEDTPNLQTFKLNGFYSKIKITIIDVYYGTEYNDTCINYLVGVKVFYTRP